MGECERARPATYRKQANAIVAHRQKAIAQLTDANITRLKRTPIIMKCSVNRSVAYGFSAFNVNCCRQIGGRN